MADIFSPQKRSYAMSRVGSKDTSPELKVRRILHKMGYRYRLHCKNLPGKPDIVLPKYRTVIFVHGCFWHGHEHCAKSKRPQSNIEFWEKKLNSNIARDKKIQDELQQLGWNVLVIWECQLAALHQLQDMLSCTLIKTFINRK